MADVPKGLRGHFHPDIAVLAHVRIAMKDFGDDGVLVTRESGASARHDIERRIHGLTAGHPVALDFANVLAISVPFADECLGQLLSGRLAGYYEDQPILAVNASPDVRETVAAALRPRRLVLLGVSDGEAELIGGDPMLNSTMEAAQRLGSFTALQLAEELGLSPQAANNRLKTLARAGALARTRVVPSRGGKEFAYEVPAVPDHGARQRPKGSRSANGRSRSPSASHR